MDINNIINKFQYPKDLADLIKSIYEELLFEFGFDFEPIIYEAFLNTEIVNCTNVYDCLKSKGMLENQYGEQSVKEGDLKRATGVYIRYPVIEFNKLSGKFEITSTTGVIAISNINLARDYIKGTIIHECGHMIKGYYKEFDIDGDILTTRSGLIETKERLSLKDGVVVREVISEKGVGLEEGLNSVLESDIAHKLISENYDVSGYKLVASIASNFLIENELKKRILSAQILKEKDELIAFFDSYFMEGAYEKLEDLTDRLYRLGLKQFSEIFSPDKMKITTEEIKRIIETEYNPFINSLDEARKKKGRE